MGRRGIRQESRFFGDLVTVDREYDLVSDGAYFRRCCDSVYRNESFRRYVVGIESFLYIGRCVVYLLVGDIYFAERVGLGRKSRQDRRSGRNDYSGRSVGRSGDCLFVDGRKIPNGFFGQFLARFLEFR